MSRLPPFLAESHCVVLTNIASADRIPLSPSQAQHPNTMLSPHSKDSFLFGEHHDTFLSSLSVGHALLLNVIMVLFWYLSFCLYDTMKAEASVQFLLKSLTRFGEV